MKPIINNIREAVILSMLVLLSAAVFAQSGQDSGVLTAEPGQTIVPEELQKQVPEEAPQTMPDAGPEAVSDMSGTDPDYRDDWFGWNDIKTADEIRSEDDLEF